MTSNTDETCTGSTKPHARAVVLMGGSMSSKYILSQLAEHVELLAVVQQTSSRWKTLRSIYRRSKKLGISYLADRLLLGLYTKLKLKRQAENSPIYREVREASSCEISARTLSVSSINDARVVDLLTELKPELVVVLGTEIIRDKVLAAAPRFVNVHAGITPLYRGSHGQFWAVMQRDWEQIGVTLHIVDKGIDTGGILGQARFRFEPATDNLLTLLAKSAYHGADLLLTWIANSKSDFQNTPTQPPPAGASRLFYSPGWSDYRKFELIARQQQTGPVLKVFDPDASQSPARKAS